jgi:hypothetical protein
MSLNKSERDHATSMRVMINNVHTCLHKIPLDVVRLIWSSPSQIEALRLFSEWINDYDWCRGSTYQSSFDNGEGTQALTVLEPAFNRIAIEDPKFLEGISRAWIGHDFWFLAMDTLKKKLNDELAWIKVTDNSDGTPMKTRLQKSDR